MSPDRWRGRGPEQEVWRSADGFSNYRNARLLRLQAPDGRGGSDQPGQLALWGCYGGLNRKWPPQELAEADGV